MSESERIKPPDKSEPGAVKPMVDDDAKTLEFNPDRDRRRSLLPIVLLIVAVVVFGVYAAKVQGDLNEAEKALQKVKKELSTAQIDLKSLSDTRDEEQAENEEQVVHAEENVLQPQPHVAQDGRGALRGVPQCHCGRGGAQEVGLRRTVEPLNPQHHVGDRAFQAIDPQRAACERLVACDAPALDLGAWHDVVAARSRLDAARRQSRL